MSLIHSITGALGSLFSIIANTIATAFGATLCIALIFLLWEAVKKVSKRMDGSAPAPSASEKPTTPAQTDDSTFPGVASIFALIGYLMCMVFKVAGAEETWLSAALGSTIMISGVEIGLAATAGSVLGLAALLDYFKVWTN